MDTRQNIFNVQRDHDFQRVRQIPVIGKGSFHREQLSDELQLLDPMLCHQRIRWFCYRVYWFRRYSDLCTFIEHASAIRSSLLNVFQISSLWWNFCQVCVAQWQLAISHVFPNYLQVFQFLNSPNQKESLVNFACGHHKFGTLLGLAH